MKLLNIGKYIRFGLIVGSVLLLQPALITSAQEKSAARKAKSAVVTFKVTNEKGEAFPGVGIVQGEGLVHTETDQNGSITLTANSLQEFITITYPGYESQVLLVSDLINSPVISLVKSKMFMTTDDDVRLPYLTVKKRYLTGSTSVFNAVTLDRYPSTDIRNALTGLVTGMEVYERDGSPGMSAEEKLGSYGASEKVGLYSRGTSLMYIIDNIRMDITEAQLDPGEIESVSLVRDIVAKSLYGPAAANGIVYITTKRGKENERLLNFNIEQGVSTIDRMPEWVSGSEYARLNNLARTNSGMIPLYSEDDIAAYSLKDPYDMNHPSVNYQDMLIKRSRSFTRANVSTSGGSDAMQYSAYLGYNSEGDNFKIGPEAGYQRINARSNLDIKINDYLKVQVNFGAGLTLRESPNYGYTSTVGEGGNQMGILEMPSLLNDITNVPPIAFPVYVNNDPSLKSPWYGLSSNGSWSNPVGNLVKNGYYTESGRSGAISTMFEWNMDNFVKGLKSKTFIDFNTFYLLRVGKAENYTAYKIDPRTYNPDPDNGGGISTLTKAYDGVDATNYSNLHDFYFQNYAAYENLSYEKAFGKHYLLASATYRLSNIKRNGFEEPQREQAGIFTALYSYKDKYNIQGVLNYGGTSGLPTNNEYSLSPTIGAGWIVSEENFMKNLTFLNYLKLRGELGWISYDEFRSPFLYRDRWNIDTYTGNTDKFGTFYGSANNYTWIGGTKQSANNYRTSPGRIGNPLIQLERRREYNIGLDALLFKNKLSVEVNYYNILRYNVLTQRGNTTPIITGTTNTLPVVNYNSYSYSGVELGLSYKDKIGHFDYNIGMNAFTQKPIIEKVDEQAYRNAYQLATGGPMDGIRGLKYLGRFSSDDEANIVPQFGETLHAGDLKYEDKNGDGVVDDNDVQLIGHGTPKLYYALNLYLSYKSFDITIIGVGRAFYNIMLDNKYFTNGSGDNTYSKFVLDNIDEAGLGSDEAGGKSYPKLTYYQIPNNFKYSSFRLADGGFFKIQDVELAYNFPVEKFYLTKGIRGMRLFVRGANLLTLSGIKDVEPENINSGVTIYPLNRTLTGGVKLTF